MAIYLGSNEQLQLFFAGVKSKMIIADSEKVIIQGSQLISSDNYILKDSNGIYLIAKEENKL